MGRLGRRKGGASRTHLLPVLRYKQVLALYGAQHLAADDAEGQLAHAVVGPNHQEHHWRVGLVRGLRLAGLGQENVLDDVL